MTNFGKVVVERRKTYAMETMAISFKKKRERKEVRMNEKVEGKGGIYRKRGVRRE